MSEYIETNTPQELRIGYRSTGSEILQTLVSLSTAAVALFFTKLADPKFHIGPTLWERLAIWGALGAFVTAVTLGLTGWLAVFQVYHLRAKQAAKVPVPRFEQRLRLWRLTRKVAFRGLLMTFLLGVLLSAAFIWVGR
jgi:hypothetical protein